mmetsp:Transcript_114891/g.287086  ORF Transcript_114891/g.287086 Transcript_114891/m.287086 type:complete len:300 (-) Transcript_114891:59-958(-)
MQSMQNWKAERVTPSSTEFDNVLSTLGVSCKRRCRQLVTGENTATYRRKLHYCRMPAHCGFLVPCDRPPLPECTAMKQLEAMRIASGCATRGSGMRPVPSFRHARHHSSCREEQDHRPQETQQLRHGGSHATAAARRPDVRSQGIVAAAVGGVGAVAVVRLILHVLVLRPATAEAVGAALLLKLSHRHGESHAHGRARREHLPARVEMVALEHARERRLVRADLRLDGVRVRRRHVLSNQAIQGLAHLWALFEALRRKVRDRADHGIRAIGAHRSSRSVCNGANGDQRCGTESHRNRQH